MPSDSPPKKDSPRLQVVEDGDQGAARALPNAIGPEKSILSSMMQEPTEYIGAAIEEHLSPGHFYIPQRTGFSTKCSVNFMRTDNPSN